MVIPQAIFSPSDLPRDIVLRDARGYSTRLHVPNLVRLYKQFYKLTQGSGYKAPSSAPGENVIGRTLSLI